MSATLADSMRRISGLLQSGQYRAALDQLEPLVAAHPEYVEGLRLLGGTQQALGEFSRAETSLRRAVSLDPSWTPSLATLAELMLAAGRGDEAEPLLKSALGGYPPSPRAAYLLVRHYLDTGRPALALATAMPWCAHGKADAELSALHVSAYAALGRQAEAVTHYRRLVEIAPDNAVIAHTLALALNVANQFEESESLVRGTLARTAPTAELHHTHARSLIALERFAQAEEALCACLRLAPRDAAAHNSLAQIIWMRTGNIAEATQVLDKVLERFAHDDALWATKAALLQGAGDARGGFACLAKRAARIEASPMLLIRAGLAALEFEPATALQFAQRALRAMPGNATARNLECAALLGVGDPQAALAGCAHLLAGSPDDQYLIAMQNTAFRLLGDARYEAACDYQAMVQSTILAPPPGWPDLASFFAELKPRLDALHNPHGHALLFQSLRHGTETTQDLARSQDPVIQALFATFAAPIARYREHIGRGSDALRRRNRGASRFNGSWSVRLHNSGYHQNHVHPRGWISSACYIELPDSMNTGRSAEGTLIFGAPGIITTPALGAEFSIRPETGMLVLFPSYFWHGTVPFHSEQPRLTVAFDVVPDATHRLQD